MESAVETLAPSSTARSFHLPELDILRFGAFLMVFFCHAVGGAPIGRSKIFLTAVGARGVDLFFALSAYLITEILLREKRDRGSINVRNFYARRILRIWPLYFTFLFALWLLPGEHWNWPNRLLFVAFLANWRFLTPGLYTHGAGILWSVSTEEQFYLAWPLLVRSSRKWFVPACAVLLIGGIAYREALLATHVNGVVLEQSTFGRLDGILAGALLAFYLDGRIPKFSKPLAWMLLFAGMLAMAVRLPIAPAFTNTVVAAGCASVLTAFMALRFGNPILEYLGKISYGLYVFHRLALSFSQAVILPNTLGRWALTTMLAFLATSCLAVASYKWLEQPFLALKNRFAWVH